MHDISIVHWYIQKQYEHKIIFYQMEGAIANVHRHKSDGVQKRHLPTFNTAYFFMQYLVLHMRILYTEFLQSKIE